jgi:hypothetical protein
MSRAAPASDAPATALTHLQRLEGESIHIIREVVAECARPVMLYSIGKDSAVMLHLARKAFYPGLPPFPLLHVDTTWKFRAMYEFRDAVARESGMQLLVHVNREGLARGVDPFSHGSRVYTDIMKTQALKQALDAHRFDAAFGGARRDEEPRQGAHFLLSLFSSPLGSKATAAGTVGALQHPRSGGRESAGVSTGELDRAGRVAIHTGGADPARAAVLCGAAAGGGARRGANHGG